MPQENVFSTGFGKALLESISGHQVAQFDWRSTRLGPFEGWPRSLKTIISAVLACPTPMIVCWGPDLTTLFNDAYRPILGARADTAMGKPFAEVWSEVWNDLRPLIDRVLEGNSDKADDVRYKFRRDGDAPQDSWWTYTSSPLRDDRDVVAGVLIVLRETTERVRADREREAASQQLLDALSAGLRIGAWDWDVVNDRVYADPQLALIHCIEPERAVAGVPCSDFLSSIHRDDLPRVQAGIDRSIATGVAHRAEYRVVSRDGDEQWISAKGMPVMDDAGRCVRLPGLSFDITANKRVKSGA